jgi:hypothetical protein
LNSTYSSLAFTITSSALGKVAPEMMDASSHQFCAAKSVACKLLLWVTIESVRVNCQAMGPSQCRRYTELLSQVFILLVNPAQTLSQRNEFLA